jgi:hypothetical protein
MILSAAAPHVTLSRFAGAVHVYDENTGNKIGQINVIRGFAHYIGVQGGAHEGVTAIVAGGVEALVAALEVGLRNGRDDRA